MNEQQQPQFAHVFGIGEQIMQALAAEFPQENLSEIDSPWGNGKKLTVIQPEAVIRRLNEVFKGDIDFIIDNTEIIGNGVGALATVTLRGRVWVGDPSGEFHHITSSRSGVGYSAIRKDNAGNIIDVGYDMKSAVTDAIKLAAKLFGVGLYLYERKGQASQPQQQQAAQGSTMPGNNQMNQPQGQNGKAMPFQVQKIDEYFRACNIPTQQWCGKYGLARPEDLSSQLAEHLLSGTHPDVVWCEQQCGKKITSGIQSSNAK